MADLTPEEARIILIGLDVLAYMGWHGNRENGEDDDLESAKWKLTEMSAPLAEPSPLRVVE